MPEQQHVAEPGRIVKLNLDILVPDSWVQLVTNDDRIFRQDHTGYWLRGIDHDGEGFLCYDRQSLGRPSNETTTHITKEWRQDPVRKLPDHWYCLCSTVAERAYLEGVKRWGVNWYHDGHTDATRYDGCIQLALLGKVAYG